MATNTKTERSMNPKSADTSEVHDCQQKERLTRIDNALFGTDGSDGLNVRIARMEVKLSTIWKQNWMLVTLWIFTIGGIALKEALTK